MHLSRFEELKADLGRNLSVKYSREEEHDVDVLKYLIIWIRTCDVETSEFYLLLGTCDDDRS